MRNSLRTLQVTLFSCLVKLFSFLPERDYFTFGYLLSQIRLSVLVCRLSVTFVHPTQPVEVIGAVSMLFCTLAIRSPPCKI